MAVETADGAAGAAPPVKKQKRPTVMIYNKSRYGQSVTIHNGAKLRPGYSAKVPAALGETLIKKIPYVVRANRGDPMG